MRRRKGLSLIEVLVAIAILALSGTAAARLAVVSARWLDEARIQRALADSAQEIVAEIRAGVRSVNGFGGDIEWEMRNIDIPVSPIGLVFPGKALEVWSRGRVYTLYIAE